MSVSRLATMIAVAGLILACHSSPTEPNTNSCGSILSANMTSQSGGTLTVYQFLFDGTPLGLPATGVTTPNPIVYRFLTGPSAGHHVFSIKVLDETVSPSTYSVTTARVRVIGGDFCDLTNRTILIPDQTVVLSIGNQVDLPFDL